MPHPTGGYRDSDGKKIPGVTTILSRFKESGGLIRWAHKRGLDGHENLYEARDTAGEIGTAAHALAEAHIKGGHIADGDGGPTDLARDIASVTEEHWPKVWSSFTAYLQFEKNTRLKFIETECPYVNMDLRCGGTPDGIAEDPDGRLVMIDFKTSSGIYPDHLIQVAAYTLLYNAAHERQIDGGAWILRFSKEHGDLSQHYYADLSEAAEAFKLMRRLYDIDKVLKKRAA